MTKLLKQDLDEWYKMRKQYTNGYHMEKWDWDNLIRLNHLVMEASHDIHNENMIGKNHPI